MCPNCRESLREGLRQERLTPSQGGDSAPSTSVIVVYCASCGWILDVSRTPVGRISAFGAVPPGLEEVQAPESEESLEGQFQVRCRDLIAETRTLGFNPNVWVDMINHLGAVEAAKKLLADNHVLVATPWLVMRGRDDLTLEHEIGLPRWAELFTDEDRAEAANRLSAARGVDTN